MPKEKDQNKKLEHTKQDLLEGSLIPEAERDSIEGNGPQIIGGGDPNLSPDAGKPIV
ncbi:hypothetical protein [Bacillus dakarensis]|uniref:hypothetical protein n=1 Tax=Robertmurraya dakarensis TaxID=1926278 RepID=UPI0012B6AB64|nr:hypothetical protein [Bacillus dakarensis]